MKANEVKEGVLMESLPEQNETELLQQKIKELAEEMNQFTYIVSHDLQAPLRMITGFLELIDKRYGMLFDDTGKQFIGHALRGSAKLKTLIFDLLDYSRISSIPMVAEPLDLAEVLAKVQLDMAPAISTSSTRIVSGSLPVIFGDKRLITLLFHQLLDNAIKFNDKAVPEIRIEAIRVESGVELSFTDNGIGMDPAFLEKIFTIFRRLHPDEQKYPGSGAGLAICRKIVALHGGTILAQSEPGAGTTFKIWLPQ